MRDIEKYSCRNYTEQDTKKRELRERIKVPIDKVRRNKKNKCKFRVTTKKVESLSKIKELCPTNLNITVAINSEKYNCKRSPNSDYFLTDLEEESISDRIQQMDEKL